MSYFDEVDFTLINVDEFIETVQSIGIGLINESKKIESCLQSGINSFRKYKSEIEDHRNIIDNFPDLLNQEIQESLSGIHNRRHNLEKKKAEEEHLKKIKEDLKKALIEGEQKVESLQNKISHVQEKTKNLQEKRDKILVYKLLTNATFCYEGRNVSGYIANQKTKKMEFFDYDPDKMTQRDITENLYKTLKNVSCVTQEAQPEGDQKEC